MRRKLEAVPAHGAPSARLAWWAAFLATLALIAILGFARSAQALTVASGGETIAAVAPSAEEADEEAETSEDEEFEAEECEAGEEEECEEEDGAQAPEECLLDSAEATVYATPGQDKIRLQIRYTTSSPTAVAVDYGLHGAKGSLYLGGERKHFARQGVLRLTQSLTASQMSKVMAARGFTVRLRPAAAPHYCQPFFDRQLDLRRATPSGLAWLQSE
jgi:hypothetical protein